MTDAPGGKPWFAAKRYGFGAGLPIAWQGWVLIIVFVLGQSAILLWAPPPLRIWLFMVLTSAFIVIAATKTQGGWRWRWGRDG